MRGGAAGRGQAWRKTGVALGSANKSGYVLAMLAADAVDRFHVVSRGQGPAVWFVHGSAADHSTWALQLASDLTQDARLCAYDRRGGQRFPFADDAIYRVEDHAADLAALVTAHGSAPVVVVGSSYGGAVALEFVRSNPGLARHAIICEPPLAASDDLAAIPVEFMAEFERLVSQQSGEAAAEFFLRTVLTDAVFERIPMIFRERSNSMWRQIRDDMRSVLAYRIDYPSLAKVTTPVTLLTGERSPSFFRSTIDALAAALPHATVEVMVNAGHLMHAEAKHEFAKVIRRALR